MLKTTVVTQHCKVKHEIMIDAFLIIRHFCTFSLRLNFVNCDHKHLKQPM